MPNYRSRLPRSKQRIYDQSNATSSIRLRPTPRLRHAVDSLPDALATGDAAVVERVAQTVTDEITTGLGVPRVRVIVSGQRPSNARGELHGLYTSDGSTSGAIKVWMITAKRGQVVAFKTFLRTLLHEVCHHLDYALLGLRDSLHTEGFYQRESSLFHQIGGNLAATRAKPAASPAPPR